MDALGPVQLLDEDDRLLGLIPEHQRAAAQRAVTAPAYQFAPGSWHPEKLVSGSESHFGILVLDGLMLRDVVVADTTCGELVGRGELLRPWDKFGTRAPTPLEIEWKILRPARIALLDDDFPKVLAAWPVLVSAFVQRAVERSHSLALHVAIHCIRRVDISLIVLFAHLADRFGEPVPAGTTVPIELTHEDLGKLVGATRQSVSSALGQLAQRDALIRCKNGSWLLKGQPPKEIERMLQRRERRSGPTTPT
jgi:CRP/FNR family cyclic AMP-dependent transcriptional regulator